MAGKRKRNRAGRDGQGENKRQRTTGFFNSKDPVVKSAVLAQYYPKVLSLREYLVSKLPSSSKIRRRKILSVGQNPQANEEDNGMARFLDQTIVGVSKHKEFSQDERMEQWTSFSQRVDISDSNIGNTSGVGRFSQLEIVDFAIWLLFSKAQASDWKCQHLLCQGFKKDLTSRMIRNDQQVHSSIPGIISTHPNDHVISIKSSPWPRVLALMGKEGERTMIDLILDCGIFLPVVNIHGTFHQLSGYPLGDIQILPQSSTQPLALRATKPKVISSVKVKTSEVLRTPASITFVRNRMMYARAALNKQGGVRFGLRHIHVLNRFPPHSDAINLEHTCRPHLNTIHVMMYMFPRQFGLHNVFTNNVDRQETIQPFKDYTLREDEIHKKYPSEKEIEVPKRLRGKVGHLVEKLQILHSRCPYKSLLQYYCPLTPEGARDQHLLAQLDDITLSTTIMPKTQQSINTISPTLGTLTRAEFPSRKVSMIDHSTPIAQVSAFCRAVLSSIIPSGFWGTGESQVHNQQVFLRNVDRFIQLRRVESFTLHEVLQGIKITEMAWLGLLSKDKKLSQSDFQKRSEIFQEFMYYIFDSILIPIIRNHFYVTESNIHKNRLFFIRHDLWKSLADPAMGSLKLSMFEEVELENAQQILASRNLGFSQVRLLPKQTGVRPIMNLKRRGLKKGSKKLLGASINHTLTPIYNILTFEKMSNPSRLGSTTWSVGDLYQKLKTFKSSLPPSSKPLYFCFVDVQSAFDTIPQSAIIELMKSLPTQPSYLIQRHAEIKPGEHRQSSTFLKPTKKFTTLAYGPDDTQTFAERLSSTLASERKNTIFVENITTQFKNTRDLLDLLKEHINHNLVKIGKKYYRQREGIPQGSVVSSLLCNYFYADLEASYLGFLSPSTSLLSRLLDDFLLVTTEKEHAKKFLEIMHAGLPAYGVRVHEDKTLVNFEMEIKGKLVRRLVGSTRFPYCGSFIDTKTLDITKDRERGRGLAISDSLTVEYSKIPGKTFHRKVLSTFKIQSHLMYLDTTHNSLHTVLSNIHNAFLETALKTYTYIRCLPSSKQPSAKLIISAIEGVVELAFVLMRTKGRKSDEERGEERGKKRFHCAVKKIQVEWMALHAFLEVLGRRQSRFRSVMAWIERRIGELRLKDGEIYVKMEGIVRQANTVE